MNNIDLNYQQLLKDIIEYGVEKQDRTGTGCKSIFGYTIRHNMKDGFPLLTTKKMAWKTMVTELLWFLRGDTNIKFLVDNGCNIWNGDAYKNYLKQYEKDKKHGVKYEDNPEYDRPFDQEEFINWIKNVDGFAKIYGELGPIYGATWRNWNGNGSPLTKDYEGNVSSYLVKPIDQIANLINDLKTNPDSRRLMVNAWNVGELDQMVLPPCHNLFQMYSVEKKGKRHLSIMVNIRSNDVPLGLPFNIASYALLLEIIAKIVDMIPEDLIINIGDAHIYLNQMEGVQEQLTREPFELPKLMIHKTDSFWSNFDVSLFNHLDINDFTIENYVHHPSIKMPLSN
jgi:thymidylate synthase